MVVAPRLLWKQWRGH